MKTETKLKKELINEIDKRLNYEENFQIYKEEQNNNKINALYASSLLFSMTMFILVLSVIYTSKICFAYGIITLLASLALAYKSENW